MNKIIFLTVLCFSFGLSQEDRGKNMRVMLKWKLTEQLDLDESQAEKFFPKMNSHEKELKSINKEILALKNKIEEQIASNSSTKRENKRMMEQIQELEKEKIDKKYSYVSSLDGVLTANQISKLLVFDKKFKKSLKDQIRKDPDYKGKHRR